MRDRIAFAVAYILVVVFGPGLLLTDPDQFKPLDYLRFIFKPNG